MPETSSPARARRPVLVTGFGLGAFLDGIVLHQVLQWHHLVSVYRSADDLAGLQHNTFWDGIFHLASWLVVFVGVVWIYETRAGPRDLGRRRFFGHLLVGWGVFNIVDQIIFHMLLGAHHIRMVENYQVYDWGYTALGAAFVAGGLALARRPRPSHAG